jgi:hypothetical protein
MVTKVFGAEARAAALVAGVSNWYCVDEWPIGPDDDEERRLLQNERR